MGDRIRPSATSEPVIILTGDYKLPLRAQVLCVRYCVELRVQDSYPGGAHSLSGLLMTGLPVMLSDRKVADLQVAGGLSLDGSLAGELCGPRRLSMLGASGRHCPNLYSSGEECFKFLLAYLFMKAKDRRFIWWDM